MKIAITATNPELDAKVEPRFGRCPYFLIVETDDLSFETMENPNVSLGGGAGIQSAQLMGEKDVKFVLTGNCGPNAHQTLAAAGVGVIVGCSGIISDVIEQFRAGKLNTVDEPNVSSKFGVAGAPNPAADSSVEFEQPPTGRTMGMGRGMSGGQGMGMGRGMGSGMGQGRGGGRGMGQGQGMGRGMGGGFTQGSVPMQQPIANPTREQELTMLQQQAEMLAQQMQQIQERIKQLGQEG